MSRTRRAGNIRQERECKSGLARQADPGRKNWSISDALAGEWVQVLQLDQRLQVYYCTTLIREIDLGIQRSTMVERWIPS